ncbi:hypothetical protein BKA83DRAFT_4128137 [Pisolithus microcarpus]|nr:hypothetical protein BKA83DRAFT_4128137 [Pisolithus microcarpus]
MKCGELQVQVEFKKALSGLIQWPLPGQQPFEFPSCGIRQISKINYFDVFCGYKWVLIVKWADPHIQKIAGELNSFVFRKGGMTTKPGSTGPMEDLSAEINAAMAAMDATALASDDDANHTTDENVPDPNTAGVLSPSAAAPAAPATVESIQPVSSEDSSTIVIPTADTTSTTSSALKSTRGHKGSRDTIAIILPSYLAT